MSFLWNLNMINIERQNVFETLVASAEGTALTINHIESVNMTVQFFRNIKVVVISIFRGKITIVINLFFG